MWACKDVRPNGTLKWQKLIPVQTVEFVACIACIAYQLLTSRCPQLKVRLVLNHHFCYWCILPPGSSICPQSCSERSSDSCHYLGDVAKYTDFSSPKWSFNVRMPMKPCLPRSCSDFKKTCGYLLYMNLWAALAILVLHFWDPALPSAIILWVCFENERFLKSQGCWPLWQKDWLGA